MTSLSTFLPHKALVRPYTARYSSSCSSAVSFSTHGKSQLLSGGNLVNSARLARAKTQALRAAEICVAQAEETAEHAPSQSLNGAGPDLERPVAGVRQEEADDILVSSTHEAEAPEEQRRSFERGYDRQRRSQDSDRRNFRSPRGGRSGGEGRRRVEDPRKAPCLDHNLKVRDVVLGRVIRSTPKGSNIELLDDPRIIGFMMFQDGPFLMRERLDEDQRSNMLLPLGLVREFVVRALPEQLEYYGKGPLLGAKDLDINVLWERARQMQHACEEDLESYTVTVTDANAGGLLATLESLPAFLPYSRMDKSKDDVWLSPEEVRAKFVGTRLEVCIKEVVPFQRKVVLDQQIAVSNKILKTLAVGSLVWGKVRRVEPYGVFVTIDGTRFSGLLHISSISQAHVEAVEDVFAPGDRVRALLTGMAEGFMRISLSTAELETTPGDMLYNKDKVYAEADEAAEAARARLLQSQEDDLFYSDDRSQGGRANGSLNFEGGFRP